MNLAVHDSTRSCRRLADAALLTCAALAITSLPARLLPWPWLAALLLPAILFAPLANRARRPLLRAAAATSLQVAACLAALQCAGPLEHPAALAGTILPPLAFVAIRRQGTDNQLGLFLAFCVLLIGTILDAPSLPILAAFATTATLHLRCSTRLVALAAAGPGATRAPHTSAQLAGALNLATAVLLAAFAIERTLAFVPAPTLGARGPVAARPSASHRVGLADTFDLTGDGVVLDLQGERLVTVTSADSEPVPDDLYLRSGFFQVPGLDTWQVGALSPEHHDASAADCRLHAPWPDAAVHRLEVTRLLGAQNRIFAPPGTCTILGVPDLLADRAREWFRQRNGARVDVYEIAFQRLPATDALAIDQRWSGNGLLDLPTDLDPSQLTGLLAEWAPTGSPLQKADSIARGLQARCRYELREPQGPHGHALLNFLHGERFGFCMHFASAAAILLRMSGVPCRIGVGLYGGRALPGGAREFGSRHSHAWVEIPIANRGWVTFDPTPPAQRGVRPDAAAAPSAENGGDTDRATVTTFDRALQRLRALADTIWPWLLLLAVMALRVWRPRRVRGEHRLAPDVRPARRWLTKIQAALAAHGLPRPAGSTLEQFVAALARSSALTPPLATAFSTYQSVRFGGRAWNRDRELAMAAGLAAAQALATLPPPPIEGPPSPR